MYSDLVCSDLVCSDLVCGDLVCGDLVCGDLVCGYRLNATLLYLYHCIDLYRKYSKFGIYSNIFLILIL